MLRMLVALVALGLASIAAASTAPTISVPNVVAMENAPAAQIVISKTAAASYTKINVQTVDGSAKAGVDYVAINQNMTLANGGTRFSLSVPLIDNKTFQGTRSLTLKITIIRFGTLASAAPITITINDDETAPPPSAGSKWIAAPLSVGGYAWPKNGGVCCNGLIFRLVAVSTSSDADPTKRQRIFALQFAADPSGNYPASNPYWQSAIGYAAEQYLEGIAPTP